MFVPERNSHYQDFATVCPGADGCYLPDQQLLLVPGNNPSDGTKLESVLAHEYGHDIANNRSNAPWYSGAWGRKRWASYMNICRRVEAGTAFPGDEGVHYKFNPGEAWAESYRQMVWTNQNFLNSSATEEP